MWFVIGLYTLLSSSSPSPPQVFYWSYHISFVLAFGGLLMKTWRIYRIFCNAELRKRVSCMQRKHSTPSFCTVSVCLSVCVSTNPLPLEIPG